MVSGAIYEISGLEAMCVIRDLRYVEIFEDRMPRDFFLRTVWKLEARGRIWNWGLN